MKHILVTISLIFGATAVSADDHLPTAGEILQNGKVLHKEIHLTRDFTYLNNKPDMTLNQYTTDVGLLVYHVLYQNDYFTCWVRAEEPTSAYTYVGCYRLSEGITEENEPEDTSEIGEVEELIEKKLKQLRSSSDSPEADAQQELLSVWGRQIYEALVEEVIREVQKGWVYKDLKVLLNIDVSTDGNLEKVEIAELSHDSSANEKALAVAKQVSLPSAPVGLMKKTYKLQFYLFL